MQSTSKKTIEFKIYPKCIPNSQVVLRYIRKCHAKAHSEKSVRIYFFEITRFSAIKGAFLKWTCLIADGLVQDVQNQVVYCAALGKEDCSCFDIPIWPTTQSHLFHDYHPNN